MYRRMKFSIAVGTPGNVQEMFAFQQRHASARCRKSVFAMVYLISSDITSRMSWMTNVRGSKS